MRSRRWEVGSGSWELRAGSWELRVRQESWTQEGASRLLCSLEKEVDPSSHFLHPSSCHPPVALRHSLRAGRGCVTGRSKESNGLLRISHGDLLLIYSQKFRDFEATSTTWSNHPTLLVPKSEALSSCVRPCIV